MAIYLRDLELVFLHVPKTAGSFLRRFFIDNFRTQSVADFHAIPLYLPKEFQEKKKFCFVRNPVDWYKSYWACLMTNIEKQANGEEGLEWLLPIPETGWAMSEPGIPWHPNRIIDVHCGRRNFNQFVKACIQHFPGYVSYQYKLYADHCDFVGKQETLVDDMVKLLCPHGVDEADLRKKLAQTPRVNEADQKWKDQAVIDPKLHNTLKRLETFEMYSNPISEDEEILYNQDFLAGGKQY